MTRARRFGSWLAVALAALPPLAVAQTAPPPTTVEAAPLPPPSTGPSPIPPPPAFAPPSPPAAVLTQPPPGGSPPNPTASARATLIPEPGDPSNADEVVLPEKPVLSLSGTSTWDDGLKSLRAAYARIEAELARLGIAPAGRPLAVFLQTTDDDFRFDAMVPVAAVPVPSPGPTLAAGLRFATTPSGKAYRFVHKAPYEEIDTTYETITTYLDAKNIAARDAFIEEYVNDVADPADPALEVNIFVQPR